MLLQGLCPLPCGAPCLRLPCDERCSLLLACGHRCPSVCGEACPDPTFCIQCGSSDIMASATWDTCSHTVLLVCSEA